MRVFGFYFIVCSIFVPVFTGAKAVNGQFDHGELMKEYDRQISKLRQICMETDFKSQITPETLKLRFQNYPIARQRMVAGLSRDEVEDYRMKLNLTNEENVMEVVSELVAQGDKDTFDVYEDMHQTKGIYEFFASGHKEVRTFSESGKLIRTLQYGLDQPKLRLASPNTWVIKEYDEKKVRTIIETESKEALPGMLPIGVFSGPFHRALAQKFSSGFDLFWEDTPKIRFWGKAGDADVYIKKHPDNPDTWIVACLIDPKMSIVPQWIVVAYLPGASQLDKKYLQPILNTVEKLPMEKSSLVPKNFFIQTVTLFEQRTNIGGFEGFPNAIRQLMPIDWDATDEGFTVEAPFQDFLMHVTDVTIHPKDRVAVDVEDGASFIDHDRKLGWTIGESDPPLPRDGKATRLVLWSIALFSVAMGILYYYKRK